MRSVFTGLSLVCLVLSSAAQSPEKLYVGWNHLFDIGLDVNQILQVNPKVGQEGSSLRGGFSFDLKNVLMESHHILENRFSIDLGATRNSSEAWYDSIANKRYNPFKKTYDQIEWRTKYSREIRDETHYLAAEQYFTTTLLPAYRGNYFSDVGGLDKLSSFLSPMSSTLSVGYERRHSFYYSIYFSPIALKNVFIWDDGIAGTPAINVHRDSIEFLGAGLHGNELTYDSEQGTVTSYRNNNLFFGSQLVINYDRPLIADRLLLKNESRLFFDYLSAPSLDFQISTELSVVIFKGFQVGIVSEFIHDNNQFFQSSSRSNQRNPEELFLHKGSSYTQRLMLRYKFEK